MMPNKELQELANALKHTSEYEQMVKLRRNVTNNYRQHMMSFEREHTRLYRQNLPEAEMVARLKELYVQYKGFLEKEEVRSFLEAARTYQKLVSECIAYLNRLLESEGSGKMF